MIAVQKKEMQNISYYVCNRKSYLILLLVVVM